jgi:hypothetical protein
MTVQKEEILKHAIGWSRNDCLAMVCFEVLKTEKQAVAKLGHRTGAAFLLLTGPSEGLGGAALSMVGIADVRLIFRCHCDMLQASSQLVVGDWESRPFDLGHHLSMVVQMTVDGILQSRQQDNKLTNWGAELSAFLGHELESISPLEERFGENRYHPKVEMRLVSYEPLWEYIGLFVVEYSELSEYRKDKGGREGAVAA